MIEISELFSKTLDCLTRMLKDPKGRVRRASLEAITSSSTAILHDAALSQNREIETRREDILSAVRALLVDPEAKVKAAAQAALTALE